MQTPLQELMSNINGFKISLQGKDDAYYLGQLDAFLHLEKLIGWLELANKEKQMVIDAFSDGQDSFSHRSIEGLVFDKHAGSYYNEKYNAEIPTTTEK